MVDRGFYADVWQPRELRHDVTLDPFQYQFVPGRPT